MAEMTETTVTMSENGLIKITQDDIIEANQLSLNCPICASPVEKNMDESPLLPVVCDQCETLYHRACWEQNGGKCAVLGCGCTQCHAYGIDYGPVLQIRPKDIPTDVQVDRMRQERLKRVERSRRQPTVQKEPQTAGF